MQAVLFDDVSFKKIPSTQYLGSKQKLVSWIIQHSPKCDSVFDAFSGSGVVAYNFKKTGMQVICNDFLTSSYYYAKAFVENNKVTLTNVEVEKLLLNNKKKRDYITKHFSNVFYTKEECEFIDNTYANIQELTNDYKKALVYAALIRTCIQKMPGGKFRSNLLKYRNKDCVHFRPKFSRDIKETFRKFLVDYNEAIFDNEKENKAYNMSIFDILPRVQTDMVYFDPPYGGSGFNYEKDYFFVEVLTQFYGKIEKFNGVTKTYDDLRDSGFVKRTELNTSFLKLFDAASHIPVWVISYNNRSIPEYGDFMQLIKKFKSHVTVHERPYSYKIGNNAGLKEYLFVCR
jgi:adenine-specific DNA-methyltransferase